MLQQTQSQKQQHKILPQQLRMLSLFHCTAQELEMQIKNELEENPFLEAQQQAEEAVASTEPEDYKDWEEYGYDDRVACQQEYQNYFADGDAPQRQIADTTNFKTELKEQYRFLEITQKQFEIGCFLIDCMDDDGLLSTPRHELMDDISFRLMQFIDDAELENIIKLLQSLEPAGIATSCISDCMLQQLERLPGKHWGVKKAKAVLQYYYSDFCRRNFEKIMRALDLDEESMGAVIKLIGTLKMKPIAQTNFEARDNVKLHPDFMVTNEGDKLQVQLIGGNSDALSVNNSAMDEYQLSGSRSADEKAARQFLKTKMDAANWFVNAIRQRENTMLKVMKAIVAAQQEYFLTGDVSEIKPMVLRNIAEQTGVDISTVSRITCNKYADTPFGLVSLKQLFSEGLQNAEGEVISNKVIKQALAEVVKLENKEEPYSDHQLVDMLGQKGFKLARRTVAKYRDQLNIPVAHLRMAMAI